MKISTKKNRFIRATRTELLMRVILMICFIRATRSLDCPEMGAGDKIQ